ncbi:hypothetical protein Ami103574_04515 [Aminipila butyrica]|uniref:Uncharacterized protein n=1 Tax=Aminipila butyrica TaxID=433296 RepID=A0A858BX10_9FIRM|nr:hypothetical protein [Aminipila butyrica]QIB68626.1 hypothetical protein Ami103574_04515 [Aminipila butyrica]
MTKEERAKQKEFTKKYDATIRQIAVAESKDMSVAEDMLKYEIRVRLGMQKREDIYKGIPEVFNWKTAEADYMELIKK